MEGAWILGKPTTLDAAIAEAAELIGASRKVLIAGLGTDVAGARAAISLAQRTGAIVDHMNSEGVLRDLDVMRSSGVMMTTPTECHTRADTLLLAGPIRGAARNELLQHVIGSDPAKAPHPREILWLCPGRQLLTLAKTIAATPIGREQDDLPRLLAALRAQITGRTTGKASVSAKRLRQVAATLKQTRFGTAIWSGAELHPLVIEMLCGPRQRFKRDDAFLGSATRAGRRRHRCIACLRLDDRLSDAHQLWPWVFPPCSLAIR